MLSENQPNSQNKEVPFSTVVFCVLLLPLAAYLFYYGYRKNKESGVRADQCRVECAEAGYAGHDFRWDVLGGPKCQCLN